MNNNNQAAQNMVAFWGEPRNIPFKGKLISDDGCMCAQGQTLYREGGYTVEHLQKITQTKANQETARILGISVTHSVLLSIINDQYPDAPQDVLTNPEKYLGPNYEEVLRFWFYLDTLNLKQWQIVKKRYKISGLTEQSGALAIAKYVAEETANIFAMRAYYATFNTALKNNQILLHNRSKNKDYFGVISLWYSILESLSKEEDGFHISCLAGYAVYELIGKPALLKNGETLKISPMFDNL
jgi:hypothetical protein